MTEYSMPDGLTPDGLDRDGGAAPRVEPHDRLEPHDRPAGITDVELAVFEGEAVLFDVQASMVHHLSAVAGATWLCCDGETSVTEMIEELADIFAITDRAELDALAESVRHSLDQFAEQGLLADRPVPEPFTMTLQPVLADDGTEILPPPPDP